MMTSSPETLEYSSIKRKRKRVVMIVVLVLASLAVAFVGRAWAKRFSVSYSRFSTERKIQVTLDNEINSIRNGTVPFGTEGKVRLPLFRPASPLFDRYVSDGWLGPRTTVANHNPFDGTQFDTTTACLAKLDAGAGARYVAVDLTMTFNTQATSVTATIYVTTEPSFIRAATPLQTVIRPVLTFSESLSVIPGTATSTDRATFKIIADGQEKTFIIILRKDDTVVLEEKSSN